MPENRPLILLNLEKQRGAFRLKIGYITTKQRFVVTKVGL